MAFQINPTHLYGRLIKRGSTPKPAVMLQVPLDFTQATTLQFSMPVQAGIKNATGLDHIQSVKIDNSNNPQTTSITFDNGDVIACPAYCQAIFPVFFGGLTLAFIAVSAGNVLVPITFLNTRENAVIWTTKIPVAGTVNVTGSQVFTQPANGAFTDASATLVAGGVANVTPLFALNGARQLLQTRNPATPTSQGIAGVEPVYLGLSDPAVTVGKKGSWELLPGESLPQFLMTTTEAIYWVAATTGHLLTAKYM